MMDIYKLLKKNTKVEIVWTNPQGQQFVFKSEIDDVLDDRILLCEPKNADKDFNAFNIYDKFTVIFCTEDGVLSGNTNLLKKNVDINNSVFICFPYNNQFCQRRENTRIPMHVEFDLTIGEDKRSFTTKNISGKGLACLTQEPLPDFIDNSAVLHMPTSDINLVCRKVYSKEMVMGDSILFLNGVAFTEISDNDVNIIIKDCLKFQIDSKHNERLFETL